MSSRKLPAYVIDVTYSTYPSRDSVLTHTLRRYAENEQHLAALLAYYQGQYPHGDIAVMRGAGYVLSPTAPGTIA